jgi:predicted transposase YbfD/YdcC
MDLKIFFEGITDPRSAINQVYPFEYLMLISLCAALAGIDSYADMEEYAETHKEFFDMYFDMPYVPRHDTFLRLFQDINMQEFENWFRVKTSELIHFIEHEAPPITPTLSDLKALNPHIKHLAIDGKTVRNSGFSNSYHIVTAWRSDHKLAIAQVKVAEKSNEITAIPVLLDTFPTLKDTVITIDAMGCQTDICEKIIQNDGDYIIAVKENQPTLFTHTQMQMEEDFETAYSTCATENKGHGRHEKRWCTAQLVNEDKFDYKQWPGIKAIYAVDADVQQKKKGIEKNTQSTRYFVSSKALQADEALAIIRSHWGIEINLHWCLDVSFNEDMACCQRENAVINMNVLRKFALNTLNVYKNRLLPGKEKKSMTRMFRYCMNPKKPITILDKLYRA